MRPMIALLTCCLLCGCRYLAPDKAFVSQCLDYGGERQIGGPPMPGAPTGWQEIPNPMPLPPANTEFIWNQLVDTIDDYFDIESEQRVTTVGGVPSEGRIETHYVPGATFLEPWRWDSASRYDRTLATFQSIRRRASVRVFPQNASLAVQVVVLQELEDVASPALAMPGSYVPRQDGALTRLTTEVVEDDRNLGWIPLGRDLDLEQEILYELNRRLVEGGA